MLELISECSNCFRQNHQTSVNIKDPGVATLSHQSTILNNGNHRLDGSGYVSKDLRGHGIKPDAYGGGLDYLHKPSGSTLGVNTDHVRRGGLLKFDLFLKRNFC